MDDINKEIIKEDIGPKLDCAKEPIGCLLWMDDVALISKVPRAASFQLYYMVFCVPFIVEHFSQVFVVVCIF